MFDVKFQNILRENNWNARIDQEARMQKRDQTEAILEISKIGSPEAKRRWRINKLVRDGMYEKMYKSSAFISAVLSDYPYLMGFK